MLTYLFGERIDYTDNAEELFEIQPRTFHSFREAAEEAAISRMYGGIHYRDAVVNGQTEGRALGQFIVGRLKEAVGGFPVRQYHHGSDPVPDVPLPYQHVSKLIQIGAPGLNPIGDHAISLYCAALGAIQGLTQ